MYSFNRVLFFGGVLRKFVLLMQIGGIVEEII